MTDDPTRKTLSIRKHAAQPPDPDQSPRRRAGARARQVALRQLDTLKQRAAATQRAPSPATGTADASGNAPRIDRRKRPPPRLESFPAFASCPRGLEDVLAVELRALGFADACPAHAGCRFHTDWPGMRRANLHSRLATRILIQVSQGPAAREDDIYDLARRTPWERWFGAQQTLRVDTSAIHSPMHSLQFCNLRAKDGICDHLRDHEGARPSIDTTRPDARVHLFLDERQATLYLDTSGESLFKRGWRLDKGAAPIRENLAAGLLALSGWTPSQPLLDPFCGSGTILIEAAWIALGVPPGIARPFGFERLRDHDDRRWRDEKEAAYAAIARRLDTPLLGCDIDDGAVADARENALRARLTREAIDFQVGDARTIDAPCQPGWVVTNPPYGERMAATTPDLWREWSGNLKKHFSGWRVNVITSDFGLPGQLRLKPRRRIPLFNGALDCRLFQFEMVDAHYAARPRTLASSPDPTRPT